MRISDWSSDVCSSDLVVGRLGRLDAVDLALAEALRMLGCAARLRVGDEAGDRPAGPGQDADQSADDRAAQEVALAAPGRRQGLRPPTAARGGGDLPVAVGTDERRSWKAGVRVGKYRCGAYQ